MNSCGKPPRPAYPFQRPVVSRTPLKLPSNHWQNLNLRVWNADQQTADISYARDQIRLSTLPATYQGRPQVCWTKNRLPCLWQKPARSGPPNRSCASPGLRFKANSQLDLRRSGPAGSRRLLRVESGQPNAGSAQSPGAPSRPGLGPHGGLLEIGRASCRERV